jgi:hypothetical protein
MGKSVRVYTMEGNPDGEAALAFFTTRGVSVEVSDVGKDAQATLDLFRLCGRLSIPTIVIAGELFLGFGKHRETIEQTIRE